MPPAGPVNNNSSILAISINVKQPIPLFTSNIQTVYFIKLDKRSNIVSYNTVIKSNYNNKECIYLLNAEPGRYAAIAAFEKDAPSQPDWQNRGSRASSYNSFYFSTDIIKLSEVEVMPGEISFMGSFTLQKPWSISFSNADEAQLHFSGLLQPDLADGEKENSFIKITSGTLCGSADYAVAVSTKELKKDLISELDFLNISLEHFSGNRLQKIFYKKELASGTGWHKIINRRIIKINTIKSLDQGKNKWIINPEVEKE